MPRPYAMRMKDLLSQLRLIGLLEGTSFLLLLFIAMPLKHLADSPGAVRVIGTIHGGLFIAFVLWVLLVGRRDRWPFKRYVHAAIASVLPFGTFVFDRTLRHEQSALHKPGA